MNDQTSSTKIPAYPSKHNLAADIADRIHGMNLDSKINNATVIETLVSPVYEALHNAQLKIGLLKLQRDNLVRMEEEQRMRANLLRKKVDDFEAVLTKIANGGNKSSESLLAEEALKR
ncbi:MAG TPA: hypothetical protein VFU31_30505 [Candidatus Binatia bacterium]|nr:hypothetical protein [Candidatus Binatia bacterium]